MVENETDQMIKKKA